MLKTPLIALLLLSTNPASAASVSITPLPAQALELGKSATIDVTLQASPGSRGLTELSVDTKVLTQDPEHDVVITVTPARVSLASGPAQVKLTLQAKTSAPSFKDGKFALVAKLDGTESRAEGAVSVLPIYTIRVIQKREGKCEDNAKAENRGSPICDFDSPTDIVYFRKHDPTLQLVFLNDTQQEFYIHGNEPPQHMPFSDGPLKPGKDYKPELIKGGKEDPNNLKGGYTLHNIYEPSRKVVFNAETIPAARSR